MAKSKAKTVKKRENKPPQSPYRATVGVTKGKHYTFVKREFDSLADLLSHVKATIVKGQGNGLREVLIGVSKKIER